MSLHNLRRLLAGALLAPVIVIAALPLLDYAPHADPEPITPITEEIPVAITPPEPVIEEVEVVVEVVPTPTPVPTQHIAKSYAPAPSSASGGKYEWMSAAGIPEDQWWAVDWIITKESGWRPSAVNPYGCVGLGQNCPDKNGNLWLVAACSNWQSDPVCQLRRFTKYAEGRYGGWIASVAAWQRQGWW